MGPALAVAAALALFVAAPTSAVAPQFPVGDEAYHTYAEVTQELQTIAYDHPSITRLTSIGKSYKGRELWMLKISDRAGVDQPEPEVLITGLTHAREHLTVEQSLALIHWLVDRYATDARARAIVDSTELWIVPMLNPDGGEYDISGGKYHMWRKNRQPNQGTTAVGTDINRNFGYKWGCCGGASFNPSSLIYAGPHPFSTPEARAERDFVNSRIVGGTEQIVLALSFHSFGELVLFPYGYTKTATPPDMVYRDRAAMRAIAQGIGQRNGYTALQESHWYTTSGTYLDWSYGHRRILTFTLELAPRTTSAGGFYLPAAKIPQETERNRNALLWFIEQARCPYDAAGITTVCGSSAAAAALLPDAASFPEAKPIHGVGIVAS